MQFFLSEIRQIYHFRSTKLGKWKSDMNLKFQLFAEIFCDLLLYPTIIGANEFQELRMRKGWRKIFLSDLFHRLLNRPLLQGFSNGLLCPKSFMVFTEKVVKLWFVDSFDGTPIKSLDKNFTEIIHPSS